MSSTKAQESPWFSKDPWLHNRFTQQGRCKLEAVGAGGCDSVKMLFVLLTINGKDLYETSRDRSPGCEPVGVVLEAPLEPKSGLPSKPLGAV